MKLFFAVLSTLFIFAGFFPYIRDIRSKKIKPQIISWLGWGFITGIGAFAMVSDGFNWGSMIVFANSFVCFFVAFYALYKKVGEFKTTKYDIVFFGLGVLGVILWQLSNNPDIAIIFAIIADASFGVLTIIKTYKDPSSETKFSWLMALLSGIAGIFALSYISFTETAYPIYLFIYDAVIFLLVYKIIKKSTEKKKV